MKVAYCSFNEFICVCMYCVQIAVAKQLERKEQMCATCLHTFSSYKKFNLSKVRFKSFCLLNWIIL